ncbi:hypothetical protein [Micromonospora tarensis]|uniref:Uncharacterized protein n=1 Tax=Micromonospora tarensis TaxID=2806100 RepID=A0ABS1YMZ2_9ACTN|nr:hypothetical protein [Micromonospora tarensis]MBM0278504.1 hypothetical protein [Micromonospora tarensis]
MAAAAVVLVLGATAVVVIVADPQRLGMTYSSGPDGTAPNGTRPMDTGPRGGPEPDPEVGPAGVGPDGTAPDGTAPDGTAADGTRPGPDATGRGSGGAATEREMTAPLADRQRGTFVLADGLSLFDLRVADLGDDLYRISGPTGSAVAPRPAVLGETVRLGLVATGGSGPRAVRVLLNERVEWRLRLVGGVSGQTLDLTRARLLGVELAGGSARTELLLPPVDGQTDSIGSGSPTTMTVRLTGGTSQLDVRVRGATPVRVRVGAGAGSVAVGDARWDGVAAGTVLGSPGWDRAAERILLDLVAGANRVAVSSG